ncbi:putative PGG domain-containing protein [Dioscorea sansibarensis]
MAVASVLAATVTFSAGFTMPGGYNSGDGSSLLSKKYPFKAFLISDTLAMVCSIVATVRIVYAGTPLIDNTLREYHLRWSMTLLWISFACMAMAFSMATYAVVVPKASRIGVLVCMISFAAPVASAIVIRQQLAYLYEIHNSSQK